jgi:hypothetical protein
LQIRTRFFLAPKGAAIFVQSQRSNRTALSVRIEQGVLPFAIQMWTQPILGTGTSGSKTSENSVNPSVLPPAVNWHYWSWCNYGCKFCIARFEDTFESEQHKRLANRDGIEGAAAIELFQCNDETILSEVKGWDFIFDAIGDFSELASNLHLLSTLNNERILEVMI